MATIQMAILSAIGCRRAPAPKKHNALRPLHDAHLGGKTEAFGAGTRVADHERAAQRQKGHRRAHIIIHHEEVSADAEEHDEFRIPVTEESSSAPKRVALPALRARDPSMASQRPPSRIRKPPSRGLLRKKATAPAVVMTTPAMVREFG